MKKGWYLVIAGFIVVGGAGIALRQPTIDVPIRAENGTFTYRCKAHDAVVASAQAAHDAYTQQLKETAKVHGAIIAKILNAPSSPGGAAAIEEAGAQYYAEAQHLRETINRTFGCLPPIRQDRPNTAPARSLHRFRIAAAHPHSHGTPNKPRLP